MKNVNIVGCMLNLIFLRKYFRVIYFLVIYFFLFTHSGQSADNYHNAIFVKLVSLALYPFQHSHSLTLAVCLWIFIAAYSLITNKSPLKVNETYEQCSIFSECFPLVAKNSCELVPTQNEATNTQ